MNLTKEKLIALWNNRTQIFKNETNRYIIKRFENIENLFSEILKDGRKITFDDNHQAKIDGAYVKFSDDIFPNTSYFSCKKDEVTEAGAYNGINRMKKRFPKDYRTLIDNTACLLGGFAFLSEEESKAEKIPPMIEEFRIISNTITSGNDKGSLLSSGQSRHPSSHFADNNYFFNVFYTIQSIANDNFTPENTKLVLRWPNDTYYNKEEEAEESQKRILEYRFPYKFFYMWTHRDSCIHLLSLMPYQELARCGDDCKHQDSGIDMDFDMFAKGWKTYSDKIANYIEPDGTKREDNFMSDLSKLLSIIMIQDQDMKNIQELLETGNKAVILYGPPGTGKTFQAKNIVFQELGLSCENGNQKEIDRLLEDNKFPKIGKTGTWALVQFHPNYTYEDFIGGISPKLSGSDLSYQLKVGLFKKFCDEAKKNDNKEKKFIMIIDEINRADLSSVFGELMYALEYRGESVSIPNFDEPFVIPSNVYLIGTMNSIDKSLVTFDLALRRRFGFFKLMPQLKAIEDMLSEYNIEENNLSKFIERCTEINNSISNKGNNLQLGPEYQIGQAYFGKVKDFLTKPKESDEKPITITILELEKLWTYHLEPLLQEYLGNRVEDNEIKREIETIRINFTKPLI